MSARWHDKDRKVIKNYHIITLCILLGTAVSSSAIADQPLSPKGMTYPYPPAQKIDALPLEAPVFTEHFSSPAGWSLRGSWTVVETPGDTEPFRQDNFCLCSQNTQSYTAEADNWAISPAIRLPETRINSLFLEFEEWFELESVYDRGWVLISTKGNPKWIPIDVRSGYSAWRTTRINISSYQGQEIKLAFRLQSDQSHEFRGWLIDNLTIGHRDDPLEAVLSSLNHQNFPFIYMNVAVSSEGEPLDDLTEDNFQVTENDELQEQFFDVIPPEEGGRVRLSDIVFLMDNSGSMQEEQEAVRINVVNFVNDLVGAGIDFNLGLCRFGAEQNQGHPIIENNGILTDDANFFVQNIWSRNVITGGFEPGWDALYDATTRFNFRPGSQKIFILITDETVTGDENRGQRSQAEAINILRANSITVFSLLNLDSPHSIGDYGVISEQTNGMYFNILSPFDQILEFISSQVANTYLVMYRSSNPVADGTRREVRVRITYRGNSVEVIGEYYPGAEPVIRRTPATLALHQRSWAEGTELTIEAEIIDNIEPFLERATLFYRTTGNPGYGSVEMRHIGNSIYSGRIPVGIVLTPGVDYYISATDGENTATSPEVDPFNRPHQIAILPNIAPEINHEPVVNLEPGVRIPIYAEIIDETNQLTLTQLHYRIKGHLIYTVVEMTEIGENQFQAIIPGNIVSEDGVEYFLYAEDDFGIGSYHGTPDDPHVIEPIPSLAEKRALIQGIRSLHKPLGGSFFTQAENEASQFVELVQAQIDAGSVSETDLEAVARLVLSERVTRQAIRDALYVSEKGAQGLRSWGIGKIVGAVLRRLSAMVKNVPLVGNGISNRLARAANDVDHSLRRLLMVFYNQLRSGQLTLDQWSAAQRLAERAFPKAGESIGKYAVENMMDLGGILDRVDDTIQHTLYLGVFELQTQGKQEEAVRRARVHNFPQGRYHQAAADATRTLTNMVNAGNIAKAVANFLAIVQSIAGTIALIASLALIVVSIVGAIATGGISLLAAVAGVASFFVTWGNIISSTAAIGEAGGAFVYVDGILPYAYVNPSVDDAFGPDLQLTPEAMVAALNQKQHKGSYGIDNYWDEFETFCQRLRTLIINGDERWATSGVDSMRYFSNLANRNEDLIIADLMASYESAQQTIRDYDTRVNSLIARTAARQCYAISIDINGFVYTSGYRDQSVIESALMALDSSISSSRFIAQLTQDLYQDLEENNIPIRSSVGIGQYRVELLDRQPYRARIYFDAVNYGSINAEGILANISLVSENSFVAGDTTKAFYLPAQDTVEVDFLCHSDDSYLSGALFLEADRADRPYFVLPGVVFNIDLLFEEVTSSSARFGPGFDGSRMVVYPNPFNPELEPLKFEFILEQAGDVTLAIYDASNKLVTKPLSNKFLQAGEVGPVFWNGRNDKGKMVSNGVYFYVLTSSSGQSYTGKFAVLR